jgi:hypothetical protein
MENTFEELVDDPKKFVQAVIDEAWDFPSFVIWMGQVMKEAGDKSDDFDT